MSEEDVRKTVEPLILEYFENNDTMEVLFTLQELLPNLGTRRWMIVSFLIELAMDHKPSHREMSSALISDLYQKVISQRDIGKGRQHIVFSLPYLSLSCSLSFFNFVINKILSTLTCLRKCSFIKYFRKPNSLYYV
jgi:programmed cell death protein 4